MASPQRDRYRQIILIAALVVLIALSGAIRFTHPAADPPQSLSYSRSIYNDGGAYALNGRHKLLYGSWIAPGDNVFIQAPAFTLAAYSVFRLFGFGLVSLRSLAMAGSMLAMILGAIMALRRWSSGAALCAVLLLTADYLFFMYGRLELIEGSLTGLVTVAVCLAVESGSSHRRPAMGALLAGCSALTVLVAFAFKGTGAILSTPIVAFLVLDGLLQIRADERVGDDPGHSRRIPLLVRPVCFATVLLVGFVAYRQLFLAPHSLLVAQYREAFQENASGLWDWRPGVVWYQVLTVTGIWGVRGSLLLLLAGCGAIDSWRRKDQWGLALALWLAIGLLYLAPQSYRPPRFSIPFVPPAAWLAGRGFWALVSRNPRDHLTLSPGSLLCALAFLLCVPGRRPGVAVSDLVGVDVRLTLLLLVLVGIGVAFKRLPGPSGLSSAFAACLVSVVLALDLMSVVQWLKSPTYSLRNSGLQLIRITRGTPTAGDNWCMALALMHSAPAYKIDWLRVDPERLKRLGVKYLVYDAQETRMSELYARWMATAKPVAILRVGHYRVRVLKLP